MNRRQRILLTTMLRSTSLHNKCKYINDQKLKNKAIGGYVGTTILMIMLILYCFFTCVGFAKYGMISIVPMLTVLSMAAICFFFTILKSNGYLFGFKEYDMLVAMPLALKDIIISKFLYMYVKNLPWMAAISVSMMLGYGIAYRPGFLVYLIWIIATVFIPIIPMVAASAIGALIVAIGSRFKYKKLVQTILTMIFVLLCFSLRFIIEGIMRNNSAENALAVAAEKIERSGNVYVPAGWFQQAICEKRIIPFLLLIVVSVAIYELFFVLISRFYTKINARLRSAVTKRDYKMSKQKQRSVVKTIAYKEFRRMMGSTTYIVNACIGEVLAVVLSLVFLIMGADKVIGIIVNGASETPAPVSVKMILPAVPYIIYYLVGMLATTACSPSLEGKNYWIVQSLPIDKMTLYKGKMLFNMYLTVPTMALGTIALCISMKASLLQILLYLVCGFVLCSKSTVWGLVCGLRFMKLDWENEIEVVKQGTSVFVYLFPNMIISTIMIVVIAARPSTLNDDLVIVIATIVELIISVICLLLLKHLVKEQK